MDQFLLGLLGVAIGGLITFFAAKFYYEKASGDLDKQVAGLKELFALVLQAIEAGGYAKVYRDDRGEPERVVVDIPRMMVEEPDRARRVLGAIGIGVEFTDQGRTEDET